MEATGADRPPMLSGVAIGRAERMSAGALRVPAGGSTGWPRIDSIGVASATLPPYSPRLSDTAPATRCTPSSPGQ